MKRALVNNRWSLVVPDDIADWDAITGWEHARFESMHRHLAPGMCLWDVGSEHGWISALYGREMVGCDNMVLIEPSIEMWRSIWLTWGYNDLPAPAATWVGFITDHSRADQADGYDRIGVWPQPAIGYVEQPAMAYRSVARDREIAATSIDAMVARGVRAPLAITVDVEGAELLVLRGAARTLADVQPLVWLSIHPDLLERDFGGTKDAVIAEMEGHGYTATFLGADHEEHWLFQHPAGVKTGW